ncbi:MAG TPA: hypothetical protein DCZ94_13095 [Lentisphaeria bacterium]|nr:MAG: hypothetical protein A2X48_06225 [Lentisphaerae bacterium GWF2_49_21]HBC87885.1 hypothetical protein [Lentisphaeria bacterium]
MKKQLYLISVLVLACTSCTWSGADKRAEAPAGKELTKTEPAKPEQPSAKKEAPLSDTKAKPAPETAAKADPNADPLAFLPDLVAKIGDEKITRDKIKEEFKPILMMMKDNGQLSAIPPEAWKAEVKERLNDIIASKILLKLAKADGYNPDPVKAEEEFKNLTAQVPPENLDETLAKQGMTKAAILENLAIGLAIKKWIDDKVVPGITVTDADAEKYYRENQDRFKRPESVRASHILITPDDIDPEKEKGMSEEDKKKAEQALKDAARKKASEILAKIKQGEDFAKLAAENSACPSKEKGGDLGAFEKGRMAEEFEKAAFAMEPGNISEVVETDYGFHIIKLTEKLKSDFMPFNDVKGFLLEGMKNQKISELIQEKIDSEKKKQNVEIFIN